jgi:hypothetical protein
MPRGRKAKDVDPANAAVLGDDVIVLGAGDRDEPVLVIEAEDPSVSVAREMAAREAANQRAAAAWARVGTFDDAERPPTPARGSKCDLCGATDQVLGSQQASGPYYCAFGCPTR